MDQPTAQRASENRDTLAPPAVILTGPTAVGKSEVAMHWAHRCGGEIISADSMQVYRGMNIGTAKPTPEEQARVPHHLLDVANPDASFDVAQYLHHAQKAVREIVGRAAVPIICGGTGLYLKAWLDGIGTAPPADPALRAQLEKTPLPVLLAELAKADPKTFDRIDRQNPRRVVRAVEVIRLTGKPFSAQRAAWSENRDTAKLPRAFVLTRRPDDLRARIDIRVQRMFETGLVEETRGLMRRGLTQNPTARQAIGYRQVIEYLDGQRSLEETVRLVQSRTWQFARRQLTWFRHQLPFPIVEIPPEETADLTVDRLLAG